MKTNFDRLVLNESPDAMVIVNRQGDFVLVDSQTEELFGDPREGLRETPKA